MQLHYTKPSPYSRKVLMTLHVLGLIDECKLVLTNPFDSEDARQHNPLGKIPVLIDKDTTLFESNLICEYLESKQEKIDLFQRNNPDYFDIQKAHHQADGVINAAVNYVFELRRDTEHSEYWLNRWQNSIHSCLETTVTDHLGDAYAPNIATISTCTALGYLDFRMPFVEWRHINPSLSTWFEEIEERRWFTSTAPST